MVFSRFRPAQPDPFGERAGALAASCDDRLTSAFGSAEAGLAPANAVVAATWRIRGTVAAALLALFPLLQATGGDVARYRRLEKRVRTGLRAIVPDADELTLEAEGATIPPTGTEQTRTLQEVDETMALALARWVVRGTTDPVSGGSWAKAKAMSKVLREAVHGYWR